MANAIAQALIPAQVVAAGEGASQRFLELLTAFT
jgi:hypothetical protein